MYRLFSLSALLILITSAEPRSPKIYNVLISTKKNLSPSHAVPVFEPVLRTTSVGIALPPLFYPPLGTSYQNTVFQPNYVVPESRESSAGSAEKINSPAQGQVKEQPVQPLPVDQFIPYSYTPQIVNNQGYISAIKQNQETESSSKLLPNLEEYYQKSEDPKNIVANFKRNPNIPDVPPPPLPVRNT